MTVTEATKVDKAERRIENTYTIGTYRVRVTTRFYKPSKTYFSTVSECRLEFHGNYTMEIATYDLSFSARLDTGDFRKEIARVPADRYNFGLLEQLQSEAVAMANRTVQELLAKGATNEELAKK